MAVVPDPDAEPDPDVVLDPVAVDDAVVVFGAHVTVPSETQSTADSGDIVAN